MKNQKICIIGDGLAGLTTALSLKNLNLDIDLYYSKKKSKYSDQRITAISNSNYKFIQNIAPGINKKLFWRCDEMYLYYENKQNIKSFLNFSKDKNLMYIFKNENFKKHVLNRLRTKNIRFIKKKIENINYTNTTLKVDKKICKYSLIILCLGGQSKLYDYITKKRSVYKDYSEIAITGYLKHKKKITNARQYFLNEGPLAILPLNNKSFSFVWSLNKTFYLKNIDNLQTIVKNKFNNLLNMNDKCIISKIQSYPIKLNLLKNYYKKNTLILGEGLHSVHPLAGQGFNLVLRDIYKIKELVDKNIKLGMTIYNSTILDDFYIQRKPENTFFGIGIDITNTFFKKNSFLDPLKDIILKNIHKFKTVKKMSKIISDKGLSS